jgi:hypothetical protein
LVTSAKFDSGLAVSPPLFSGLFFNHECVCSAGLPRQSKLNQFPLAVCKKLLVTPQKNAVFILF